MIQQRRITTTCNSVWDPSIGDDDELDTIQPLQSSVAKRSANFVEPVRQLPVVARPTLPVELVQSHTFDIAPVFSPSDGAREHTSAMDRAHALRVRLLPFLLMWGGLAIVVGVVAWRIADSVPVASMVGLLLFCVMGAGTYIKLNTTDYQHSREGTERHRINTAADIAHAQLQHDYELRKMALESYLKIMERQ